MVRSRLDEGAAVAAFLVKCYEMVGDPTTDGVISWCTDGASFCIADVADFQTRLLPTYFKHNNFSSFIRQLNIYGFRKIDTDKWVFANDGFIKGQKNLLKTIHRRKQSQVIVQQKTMSQQKENDDIISCEKEKKLNGLWSEVECLKADKNLIMQELVNLRQHQENSHGKLALLREQIKDMEKDQQQMLSFIVMAMQNPGFLVHILQPKEPSWRKTEPSKGVFNRVIDDDLEENDPSSEVLIVRYQPPINQSPAQINTNKFLESDASNDEFNDIFAGIDFLSETMDYDLFSSENYGQGTSDQLDKYSALEQLLFSSPPHEDKENDTFNSGECEMESQNSKMESVTLESKLERDEKLEILTERMENLASECNIKQ